MRIEETRRHLSNAVGLPVKIGFRNWEINGDDKQVDASRIGTLEQAEAEAKLLGECKQDGVEEHVVLQRIKDAHPASNQAQEEGLLGWRLAMGRSALGVVI